MYYISAHTPSRVYRMSTHTLYQPTHLPQYIPCQPIHCINPHTFPSISHVNPYIISAHTPSPVYPMSTHTLYQPTHLPQYIPCQPIHYINPNIFYSLFQINHNIISCQPTHLLQFMPCPPIYTISTITPSTIYMYEPIYYNSSCKRLWIMLI